MAALDFRDRTFFTIKPSKDCSRVVFQEVGFDLKDIMLITDCVMEYELKYKFTVHIGYTDDMKLDFVFRKKSDCLIAQRELTRAWTKTGEFADEDVDAGEGTVL